MKHLGESQKELLERLQEDQMKILRLSFLRNSYSRWHSWNDLRRTPGGIYGRASGLTPEGISKAPLG